MKIIRTSVVITLFLINIFVFSENISKNQIILIHSFLFGLMVITEKIEKKTAKKAKKLVAYFFTINIFRVVIIILFLSPIVFFSETNKKEIAINFFVVYFLYMLLFL